MDSAYLLLSGILFAIGAFGVVTRRNVLVIMMSVEIMLSGVNLAFISAGARFSDPTGSVLAFMVITVAAAEAALGLAIVIALCRVKETVDVTELTVMRR